MGGDLTSLAAEASPYLTAAIGAYGVAVLAKARDRVADATVELGRQILRRIFGTRGEGDLPAVIADLAANPDDPDLQGALRVQVRKALGADTHMADDVREMLRIAPAINITASGDRSIAAHSVTGIAITGDNPSVKR
jgi:hypothetical protein